jgi:hypothetical protein
METEMKHIETEVKRIETEVKHLQDHMNLNEVRIGHEESDEQNNRQTFTDINCGYKYRSGDRGRSNASTTWTPHLVVAAMYLPFRSHPLATLRSENPNRALDHPVLDGLNTDTRVKGEHTTLGSQTKMIEHGNASPIWVPFKLDHSELRSHGWSCSDSHTLPEISSHLS